MKPQIAAGFTIAARSALLADLPAIAETVAGYDFNGWAGLIAPKGTPRPIIERLHAAMILAAQGADVFPGNADEFRKFLARDIANTERVMKAAPLQPGIVGRTLTQFSRHGHCCLFLSARLGGEMEKLQHWRRKQEGKLGYILLWALGVPIPVLFVIFLLRGCT